MPYNATSQHDLRRTVTDNCNYISEKDNTS